MKIYDLTEELRKGVSPAVNLYFFNNGLLRLRDELFLMPYRAIYYDLPVPCHPWKAWWEGDKLFGGRSDGRAQKHRKVLGGDRVFRLSPGTVDGIDRRLPEHDGTGLALVKFAPGGPRVVANATNLFGEEMNQDARICRGADGKIYLTYNGFVDGAVCMLRRTLTLSDDGLTGYLSHEEPMDPARTRGVEKNWVMHPAPVTAGVVYKIHETFDVLRGGDLLRTKCPAVAAVRKFYGRRCQFSMGSPPVAYGDDEFLAVGHLKVKYKEFTPDEESPFAEFLRRTDFRKVSRHGKYVYFMYFYCYRMGPEGAKGCSNLPFFPVTTAFCFFKENDDPSLRRS
ncbi:MAG: hypothetical protein ACYCOU_02330 [Sulfobacillus sp.]